MIHDCIYALNAKKSYMWLTHSLMVIVEREAGGGEREGDFLTILTILCFAASRSGSLLAWLLWSFPSSPTCLLPDSTLHSSAISILSLSFTAIASSAADAIEHERYQRFLFIDSTAHCACIYR